MGLQGHYDVIVVGNDLATALGAALLSNAGRKVLLVEKAVHDHAFLSQGFPLDPELSIYFGLGENAAFGRSLRELGLFHREDFVDLSEVAQIVSPQYRMLVGNTADLTMRDLQREFYDADRAGLEQFFSLLYGSSSGAPGFALDVLGPGQGGTAQVTQWKRYFSRVLPIERPTHRPLGFSSLPSKFPAQLIEELTAPIVGFGSFSSPKGINLEQGIRYLAVALEGQSYYKGGFTALRKLIHKKIQDTGGTIKQDTRVESLVVESNEICGTLLSSFEGVVYGDHIILGSQQQKLYKTLPSENQDRGILRDLSKIEATHWRYTITFSVNRDSLPVGMSSNLVYINDFSLPLEEENYLMIRVMPEEVIGAQDENAIVIGVTVLVPNKPSYLDYEYLRKLSGRILRQLENLIPFIEFNIKRIIPDFRRNTGMIAECYPKDPTTHQMDESLLQYYIHGDKEIQAFNSISWSNAHQNLYFAGRTVWPSLGTYGEVLCARKIYEDIIRSQK